MRRAEAQASRKVESGCLRHVSAPPGARLAITPPSDIVLDVAKAADPVAYRAAVEKLARIGGDVGTSAAAAGFEAVLGGVEAEQTSQPAVTADWRRADLRSRLPLNGQDQAAAPAEPYRQFEAFVLQTFIESMLPKDANHVFGDGIAGSFWSSMLAEQIAGQLAEAGGLGIANTIASQGTVSARPDGFSALPGYVSSLEMRFADALFSAEAADDGPGSTGEG